MRLLVFLLTLNLLLVVGARAQSQSKVASRASGDTMEVRRMLEQVYAAWSDLDPAKVAKFYAKDSDLTFFDAAPMKYNGWAEYAAGVPKVFAPYRSGKFTLNDDLSIHRRGNWAWATATWSDDLVKKDGSHESLAGRYTSVLEKRGRHWLIVHEHISVPMK